MNTNKIKNLDDLREFAISLLERADKGEIEKEELGVAAKMCESIISTVKTQLAYAHMVGRKPNIPFTGNCLEQEIQHVDFKKLVKE